MRIERSRLPLRQTEGPEFVFVAVPSFFEWNSLTTFPLICGPKQISPFPAGDQVAALLVNGRRFQPFLCGITRYQLSPGHHPNQENALAPAIYEMICFRSGILALGGSMRY